MGQNAEALRAPGRSCERRCQPHETVGHRGRGDTTWVWLIKAGDARGVTLAGTVSRPVTSRLRCGQPRSVSEVTQFSKKGNLVFQPT
jgi:hypothetical protein